MGVIQSFVKRLGIGGALPLFFWRRQYWRLSPMILPPGAFIIFVPRATLAAFIHALF